MSQTAVGGLIRWAWMQAGVQKILAETKEENLSSQKVLFKNGFLRYKRMDEMLWWQLHRPVFSIR